MFQPRGRQVAGVDIAVVEDDGVRLVEQQPVGRRLAVGEAAAGRLEGSRPQTEVVGGAAVVLCPEQDDARLHFALHLPLFCSTTNRVRSSRRLLLLGRDPHWPSLLSFVFTGNPSQRYESGVVTPLVTSPPLHNPSWVATPIRLHFLVRVVAGNPSQRHESGVMTPLVTPLHDPSWVATPICLHFLVRVVTGNAGEDTRGGRDPFGYPLHDPSLVATPDFSIVD